MFHFSTAALLAANFLFVSAGGSSYTVTTCDGNSVHRLSCESGVISVETALYGRADMQTCSEGKLSAETSNTNCSLSLAAGVIKERCDGKTACEMSPTDFGATDPCHGTFKYLKTKYSCIPAVSLVTCEHSYAHLQCDEGGLIFVASADYGRSDRTTCTYKRPTSQVTNVHCSLPTSKVADSCNGRNSCIVKASNSVFGDPCVGTYKYLKVAYLCEYVSSSDDSTV